MKKAIILVTWVALHGSVAAQEADEGEDPLIQTHMSEAYRGGVSKIVVLPTTAPAAGAITGSYEKQSLGVLGGAAKGGSVADGVGTDIGGIRIGYPIPILRLPGMLLGGLAGGAQQRLQDFRDAMTRDLADSADMQLTNDALASDVFWQVRGLSGLDPKVYALSTPLPEDTQAVLFVALTDVIIEVQGKEAIVTTQAVATLRQMPENKDLYRTVVQYQDRDTLANWTRDDNALWRIYANYARHYIGRQIAGEVFARVDVNHELVPAKSGSLQPVKKNPWHAVSKTATPTLAWDLTLLGNDVYGEWSAGLRAEDVSWDIELYDEYQPIYAASNLAGTSHTLDQALPCKAGYRWSVRPSYTVDGTVRIGEWMRMDGGKTTKDGSSGGAASEAPAYLYDFARLDLKCRD